MGEVNIYDAIDALEEVYDSNVPYIGDEDAEKFANALEVIYQFARKYEPRAEDLLIEFTCDCGTHMTRNRITDDGDAEFICSNCNAVWRLGRSF
jgi:hypothetical protein